MTPRQFTSSLTGVFGFPVTPFHRDLSLNLDALAENVDQMARYPFCAMVAAGGTGEVYSMTPEEIERVVKVTVEAVNGRMPVVAGTGLQSRDGMRYCAPRATGGRGVRAGSAALLQSCSGRRAVSVLRGDRAGDALPLMIYSRDWAVFSPQQVARLCDRVPTLAAWKDGQGNGRTYQRIMNYNGDRLAWLGGLGDDCVPTYFAAGVQAFTSSISNIAPRLSLELADAGDEARFRASGSADGEVRESAVCPARTGQRV